MHIGNLVFSQLMEFAPWHTFRRLVAKYRVAESDPAQKDLMIRLILNLPWRTVAHERARLHRVGSQRCRARVVGESRLRG